MTPPLTTVNVTAQATLLYGSQGSTATPMQVVNLDATHTVWVGNASNITAGGSNAIPLGAGASAGFDGSVSVYAVTAGAAVSVAVTPGGTSYSPGTIAINGNVNATVSGNVNVTNTPNVNVSSGSLTATVSGPVQIEPTAGQPLDVSAATVIINPSAGFILPGSTATILSNTGNNSVAPGTGFGSPVIDVSKYQSCDFKINAFAQSQATAGAALVAQLRLQWFDDVLATNQVYIEDIYFYLGNASVTAQPVSGSTPVYGHYLIASVLNPGTAANITVNNITITGSYRTPVYSSWRQSVPSTSGITCTGTTIASLSAPLFAVNPPAASGNLGMLPNVTPGTGLRVYLLPLYAGPVSCYWSVNTAGLSNVGTLVDLSFTTSGNLVAGTSQPGMLRALSNTIGTAESFTVNFPRSPMVLVVNPAATSQLQFSAIGQQGY